jgi:hypothetical protein
MEANALASTLATAERVRPADAGVRRDRSDRPARSLVLPARCISMEGDHFCAYSGLSGSARAFYYQGMNIERKMREARRKEKTEARREKRKARSQLKGANRLDR